MLLIVKEYPSRSNLNSFPEFYEASAERVLNSWSTLDCRHPLSGENHYQYFNHFKELTCSLVVDSHSRFTILSQQVNVLYEFPVSYNHLSFTNVVTLFQSTKHFVKYFYFFCLVVYLLSACKWEDYCMIRQLTSKPISSTKICNHFWFAKHFVKYFYFFLRSFFSSLKSSPGGTRTHNRMDCGLNAACIPISPPNHFYHYVKEPFSFVSQRYKSFLKPQNY